jgi:cyclic pyranopterin phosphate synthase
MQKSIFSKVPELRITVNSRCGRACFFCRPSGEAVETSPGVELDIETVLTVAKICEDFGISYIKLTGGDPALWPPLAECVERLKRETTCRVEAISRHPRIGLLAEALAQAGTDMLNISIDTLDPDLHRKITGVNDLAEILDALKTCIGAGLPCKVNMVVLAQVNDHEIGGIISFCESVGVKVVKLLDLMADIEDGTETFARRMRLLGFDSLRELYLPLQNVAEGLRKRAVDERQFRQLGGLGNPMLDFTMKSGMEVIVKDHHAGAWYGSICKGCKYYPCSSALMALRLTADARLQYCLLREDSVRGYNAYTPRATLHRD